MCSSSNDALSEKRLGQEALVCTPVDRRNTLRAVAHFLRAQAWDELHTVLDLARRTGDVRAVCEIERIGQEQDRSEFCLSDFNEWLITHGIKWFDLYEDERLGIRFISDQDVVFFERLISECFASRKEFWNKVLVSLSHDVSYPQYRRELLECLAQGRPPVVLSGRDDPREIEESFFRYCDEQGMTVFKRYQEPNQSLGQRSFVYLVLDHDGLLKVFKQLPSREHNAFTITKPSEPDIYAVLPAAEYVPRFYGVVEISDQIRFMKTSVVFGQSLAELVQTAPLNAQESGHIIACLARALEQFHNQGIVYLDLRPENVKINDDEVVLLDLGDARFVDGTTGWVDTYLSDTRYVSPEVALTCRATYASDIFQLGILFHLLLTGEHPFLKGERGNSRQEEVVLYSLSHAFEPYPENTGLHPLLVRMLEKDPTKRPTAHEVAEVLGGQPTVIHHQSREGGRPREKNMVLFPARMGIPHKGHIEFMARILELGYHLKISLQCSYVISEIDPIPKWVVMKMVAQALFEKGFGSEDFHFMFTPLPVTDEEHRLWFALMDDWTDVVAIASGNPEVHVLFAHARKAFIDQRMLFGVESEEYQDRSWGSYLRQAVREQDQQLFNQYIAHGSQRVASLEQLRAMYAATPICAKQGRIVTVLLDEHGAELVHTSVIPMLGPEASLLRALERIGKQVVVKDTYAPESRIEIDGGKYSIRYERMEVTGEDQTSFFVVHRM